MLTLCSVVASAQSYSPVLLTQEEYATKFTYTWTDKDNVVHDTSKCGAICIILLMKSIYQSKLVE